MDITHDIARRLRNAYSTGAIAPLRDALAPDDAVGAYAVQAVNTAYWIDAGQRVVGKKVGLTSKAVQVQLGVDQPDFGVLFDDMALAHDDILDMSLLLQPKAEVEVALILGDNVDIADATPEDVARATLAVAPAIEIVDSRIADWKITLADTVADNGSSAAFVLGDERHRGRPLRMRHGAGAEWGGRVDRRGRRLPRPSAQRRRLAGADAGRRGNAAGRWRHHPDGRP